MKGQGQYRIVELLMALKPISVPHWAIAPEPIIHQGNQTGAEANSCMVLVLLDHSRCWYQYGVGKQVLDDIWFLYILSMSQCNSAEKYEHQISE